MERKIMDMRVMAENDLKSIRSLKERVINSDVHFPEIGKP